MTSSFEIEIRNDLLQALEPLVLRLTEELKRLVSTGIDESAYLISFEIYPPSFISRFPVRFDWFDSDLAQIEGGPLLVGSVGILNKSHYTSEDPLPFALPVLIDWFSKRWQEAGGFEYSLPAYIECRGSEAIYDLKNQNWVDRASIT